MEIRGRALKMRIMIFIILFININKANAIYCSYNAGDRKFCMGDYQGCLAESRKLGIELPSDLCRSEEQRVYTKSLKINDPGAMCLWIENKKKLVNLGCMKSDVCKYANSQHQNTVCINGSIKNQGEIKKIFDSNIRKQISLRESENKKALAKEEQIFSKGTPTEIIELISYKHSHLKITSREDVARAKKMLEPFCTNNEPQACFVLHGLVKNSDFKEKWNQKPEEECENLKNSFVYIEKACRLGFRVACDEIHNVESKFFRSSEQNNTQQDMMDPDDEAVPGLRCEVPSLSEEVKAMIDKCKNSHDSKSNSCIYSLKSDLPIEKMSYDQLVSEGDNARGFNKIPEAILFYEKACDKKESYVCIDLAFLVREIDFQRGSKIFFKICNSENKKIKTDLKIQSGCEQAYRMFKSRSD